jgi:hypothetical protein
MRFNLQRTGRNAPALLLRDRTLRDRTLLSRDREGADSPTAWLAGFVVVPLLLQLHKPERGAAIAREGGIAV